MSSVMKTTRDVKGIGLSILRPDAPDKVTGQVQYVADLNPRGLLHAKLLRSPHAHAKIVRIDVSRARVLPGVRAVLTAADIPVLKKKAPTRAHAVLAIDRVVFAGQPVAAVAADELAIAEEALDLIDVQYEVLPVAADPLESMKPGAPPVAELGTEADTSEALAHGSVAGVTTEAKSAKAVNISQQARLQRGDVAKALAESEVVIEKTYRVPMVHQGYLQPHAVAGVFLASLYLWPNFDVKGFEVLTHKPSIAAYRAPVAPQTIFAIDSQMEQIAKAIGADPVEFRLRHLQREGDKMANNQPWLSNGAVEVLTRLAEHPLWKKRAEWKASSKDGKLRGTGLSLGGWLGGLQPTGATVRLNPDGTLQVLTGQVDIAGTNIALAQIAATAYGVDIDKVKITTGDTDVAPLTGLSAGSKTTYTVGVAVMQAAQNARNQTLEIAAKELEASVHDLEIDDGKVVVRGVPNKGVARAQIGKKGNLYMSKVEPVLGVSHPAFSVQAPAFCAQLAKIEIDPDTGELTLHDFVVVQDVGKAINPLQIEGQMQGGAVQSLGMALTEALMYDDKGRLMNPSLLDYRKLTAADLPNIETIIVEKPAPHGPFGARGVGEPPIVPAPAAIANAVEDATGVRLTVLPLSPERIALAIANGK